MILTDEEIEKYISEITSGLKPVSVLTEDGERMLMLRNPTTHERRIANVKYEQAFNKAKEQGIRTQKEITSDFINKNDIFTEADAAKARNILGQMEALKKQIDLSIVEHQQNVYRDRLRQKEMNYYNLVREKNTYEALSAEVLADKERFNYYAYCCTLDFYTLEPLWNSLEEFKDDNDAILREGIRIETRSFIYGYESSVLRALARSGQWKAVWSISVKTGVELFGMEIPGRNGKGLFGGPVSSWSYSQIQLANWSIFYDNILQSPNPPPKSVIENDFLLDKWVEKEVEKQEKERVKYQGSGNAYDHEDVFVLDGSTQKLVFNDDTGELRN